MESVTGAPMRAAAGGDVVFQFSVADVDAAADLLRARNVVLLTAPHDQASWGMRIFHVRDPLGHVLELTMPIAR